MENRLKSATSRIAIVALLAFGQGCASLQPIENSENVGQGESYQAQYRATADDEAERARKSSVLMNAQRCAPDQKLGPAGSQRVPPDIDFLSPGDLIDVSISDDDVISGKYEVSQDGMLRLMHVPPVSAKGRSVDSIEESVRRTLIDQGLYNTVPLVSIRVMDFAPARVFVAGAVFDPGSVTVGSVAVTSIDRLRQETLGGRTTERRLARALQSAGGVRPDADLSRVTVWRGGSKKVYDMRPVITGHAYPDPVLLEGDQVEIPSRGCFQEELMAPSAVSPPGAKVFMSNLSVPASSNSQAAISKDTVELRYGTRFLQAVFSLNCVGGARLTNSSRSAVLFTRNPITGQSIVIERNLEDLLRRSDRDDFDPYLMPGDALACYDSSVINITDLATKLGIIGALGVII
ncbi:polysaccharide biosynthesis/export family protein [Martelella endophytica]|uniref:Polysaccharide export protein N-terminal domain-containing protein n=1 Tax=Martelella endophytica TaxID=1486262 RepID=A0A0D5LVB5_MAREN|nr:polysaccharide biosynthesis/export family protein [Martelella endophytica]AJY47328.1 hypothetical protein TM49_19310 [Martelella endophytica]